MTISNDTNIELYVMQIESVQEKLENLKTELPEDTEFESQWLENNILQRLSLWVNRLISLPDSIGNLRNLQELNLSGNRLTGLPDSLVI